MELAVRQEDADVLLKQKNILDEVVLEKYRVAGQITQTGLTYIRSLINNSYHLTGAKITVQQLCLLTDSFLLKLLSRQYVNTVNEKGIAHPTTINVNELINGFAPEIDDERTFTFNEGDVVTINLGVHIDGYASQVSHTMVIYPPSPDFKPSGPLLGSNADAICAANVAVETMVALLGSSLSPEKLPNNLRNQSNTITGQQIRGLVDAIADSFNCIVVPGSKIRRVRRFLAGQAEGVVAERDFKGVVWDESHQESRLLKQATTSTELIVQDNTPKPSQTNNSTAVPTDEFVVLPGEVYQIDIRMAGLQNVGEIGIITTEEIDHFTGKNNRQEFNCKSSIFIRDFAITHQLKLKTSRKLLSEIDNEFSVFPFKLDYIGKNFPINLETSDEEITKQIEAIGQDMKSHRLGASELTNRHLIKAKPIQITKFIPLEQILLTANPTGKHGIDAAKPVLPGMEIPLPKLGISSLKLKALLKHGKNISNVRESTTVIINNTGNEVVRLTGGEKTARPSWVHSQYKLTGEINETVSHLIQLTKDKRFGIKVKEINPYKMSQSNMAVESMQLD
ncbi:putative metalloprotease ARX1 [Spathaspora sp. JA1]|nr:putative metalloprotease ARX1 [Spathaspora sp. JA1]